MASNARVAVMAITNVTPPPLRLDLVRARAHRQALRMQRRLRAFVFAAVVLCVTGLAFGVSRVAAPHAGAPVAAMTPAPTMT